VPDCGGQRFESREPPSVNTRRSYGCTPNSGRACASGSNGAGKGSPAGHDPHRHQPSRLRRARPNDSFWQRQLRGGKSTTRASAEFGLPAAVVDRLAGIRDPGESFSGLRRRTHGTRAWPLLILAGTSRPSSPARTSHRRYAAGHAQCGRKCGDIVDEIKAKMMSNEFVVANRPRCGVVVSTKRFQRRCGRVAGPLVPLNLKDDHLPSSRALMPALSTAEI
jgi:hypothetical protein